MVTKESREAPEGGEAREGGWETIQAEHLHQHRVSAAHHHAWDNNIVSFLFGS